MSALARYLPAIAWPTGKERGAGAVRQSGAKRKNAAEAEDGGMEEPATPEQAEERRAAKRTRPEEAVLPPTRDTELADLPFDLLRIILLHLGTPRDICAAQQCWTSAAARAVVEARWRDLYVEQLGLGPLTERAAAAAGSWNALFKSKTLKLREAKTAAAPGDQPWDEPCSFELQVALEALVEGAPAAQRGRGLAIVFLLDGSGSVTEDDFKTMTGFVGTALRAVAAARPDARAAVLQFSNDVRTEAALRPVGDPASYASQLDTISRMNGGTNIALALQKAGQVFKGADLEADVVGVQTPLPPPPPPPLSSPQHSAADGSTSGVGDAEVGGEGAPPAGQPAAAAQLPQRTSERVIVLLTDGRVDGYQAREAMSVMGRLADEQAPVSLHTFGVGRGVDKAALVQIVDASGAIGSGASAERHYVGLRTMDENPW